MIQRFLKPPEHDRWEDYFEPGETLLWQGAPEPGLKSALGTMFFSAFGVPFLLGGLFAAAQGVNIFFQQDGLWAIGPALFLLAFSVPFLAVGFGLTVGSWLVSLYGHRYTQYALTNKRAYIANSFFRHSLKSYKVGPEDIITLKQGRFDSVQFKTVHEHDAEDGHRTKSIGFDGISNGREVYAIIRQIQSEIA